MYIAIEVYIILNFDSNIESIELLIMLDASKIILELLKILSFKINISRTTGISNNLKNAAGDIKKISFGAKDATYINKTNIAPKKIIARI